MNSSGKPVTRARLASWAILAATTATVLFFVAQTGMFSAFFTKKEVKKVNIPLPDQVSSGFSTITGFDKEKQPYKLTAQKVVQDEKDSKKAHLTTVDATLKKKNGEILKMDAQTGVYKSENKVLDLAGKVRLSSKDRFVAHLEKATVILKEKRMYAKVPVKVLFDRGSINANGMEVLDNGKKIEFFDGVKFRYEPAENDKGAQKADRKEN